MPSKSDQIISIIKDMRKTNQAYDEGAVTIWHLLSSEEQECLRWVFSRKPIWKGEIEDTHPIFDLLTYKLVTWTSAAGNEGYITGTFIGYAVMKSMKT